MNQIRSCACSCLRNVLNRNQYRLSYFLPPNSPEIIFPHPINSKAFTVGKLLKDGDGGGIFGRVKSVFSSVLQRSIRKRDAYKLYDEMTKNVNYLHFLEVFKMPDTFNSWFLVTELHVWMLMVRLMAETDKDSVGRGLRNDIVEAMWQDASTKAKKLDPHNSSVVKKQLSKLSDQFQMALLVYDEGIQSSDTVLVSALWFRFFSKECTDPRQLELLVSYTRHQVQNLMNVSLDDLQELKIRWTSLKDLTKI